VEDVGGYLRSLAKQSLLAKPRKVIGITGSVGKTTVKDFTATLLAAKFQVAKTVASHNSKLTLPLTILNAPLSDVLVLEMGMSEPGDLDRLIDIAPPDIAVITKVGLAHAASFPGGIEEIAHHKRTIFSHPRTKIHLSDFPLHAPYTFSITDPEATFFLDNHRILENSCPSPSFQLPFKLPHFLHNFLAAASIARLAGLSWEEIFSKLHALQLPPMRFETFSRHGVQFINDAYNANPESMRAALQSLSLYSGRKIALLGSMKELGSFSSASHLEIIQYAASIADLILTLGPEMEGLPHAIHFRDHASLASHLRYLLMPGDTVLIKGSRSMEMEKILCYFT
jgi:UDP-N-acetylmuramoyl-tripeptide--D-alanyl-D-alanine ligase